jgi:hypothetical protein
MGIGGQTRSITQAGGVAMGGFVIDEQAISIMAFVNGMDMLHLVGGLLAPRLND